MASENKCESGCGCVLGQAGKANDCVMVLGCSNNAHESDMVDLSHVPYP